MIVMNASEVFMSTFFNIKMIYAILCFIAGHVLGWYTHNLQFVNEFWKDKIVLPTILFGIFTAIAMLIAMLGVLITLPAGLTKIKL